MTNVWTVMLAATPPAALEHRFRCKSNTADQEDASPSEPLPQLAGLTGAQAFIFHVSSDFHAIDKVHTALRHLNESLIMIYL